MVFLFFILYFFLVKPVTADSVIKISGYSATSPEYVELTNSSNQEVNIAGWYFKDLVGTSKPVTTNSIAANATIKNEYSSGWLNDSGDTIYLYDSSNNIISQLTYPIPTSTPTPTQIPTPTNTPTPDPTIINPTSGISLTEFMPYSSIEWAEIYNDNSQPVKLSGWKFVDNSSNTKSLPDLTIAAKSYATYDFSGFLNNDGDTISLINNSSQTISQRIYENNKYTLDYSWSIINNSWCQASMTKGYANVTSCYSPPTSTPTPTPTQTLTPTSTNTPTPNPNRTKFTSSDTATESAIIEPISESNYPSPSLTPTTSPTGVILGADTISTTKKNYLPLILIISGGLLLTSPLIISKLKK